MTSDNVIEFPTQSIKLKQLEEQINKGVTDLEIKYTELDLLHDRLNEQEKEANELEKSYDVILKQYVDLEGIENTPALWLTYSRSCAVKAIAEGEYEMIWLGTDLEDE